MNKTEKFWDKQVNKYDKTEKKFEPAFDIILNSTRKYLKPSDTVLDFGCATGEKSLRFTSEIKMLYGIDIQPEMIKEAKRKSDEENIRNVKFSKANIIENGFKNSLFDVIISYGVLHLLKENDKVFQKIGQLLKPGGLFISSTACLKDKMNFRSKFVFSLYLIIKKIGLFPLHLNMFKTSDVKELIEKGNFQILESQTIYHGITIYFIIAEKK